MLVVETIANIRRLHLLKGRSISGIAHEIGISMNTVRKVVLGGGTEHRYTDRSRQPPPKPGGYVQEPGAFLGGTRGGRRTGG